MFTQIIPLFYWLSTWAPHWAHLSFLRYTSMRAMASLVFSFAVVVICMPAFIGFMQRKYAQGQPIRPDGPSSHKETKHGTPTMGGLLLVLAFTLSALLWSNWKNPQVAILWLSFVAFGAIGSLDDYKKLRQGSFRGLSPRNKFLLQGVMALAMTGLIIMVYPTTLQTSLFLPIFKNLIIPLGVILYSLFGSFLIVGASNGVNLTDGLDGLAIGSIMSSYTVLGIIAYLVSHKGFALYLHLPHIPDARETVVLCSSLLGGSMGFLWFNTYPARIFMGDIGALALGAFLAVASMLIKQEITLAIFGGIFVIETLSVILQVLFFKSTRQRIFLMAPLHHHFEKMGWSESQIVVRFWMVGFFLGLLALFTLKLR